MSKNDILDKLMSKIKWRDCLIDITQNKVKFIVDYDNGNVVGVPTLFQLKLFVYQMFDIVYFYPKLQYAISSDNMYIIVCKSLNEYVLKVGQYESKVEFTRSSLEEKD